MHKKRLSAYLAVPIRGALDDSAGLRPVLNEPEIADGGCPSIRKVTSCDLFAIQPFPNLDYKTATAIQVLMWRQAHVQNRMHGGIKKRLNSGNVCCNSVQNPFLPV
jgi:hypothetical protein